MPLTKDERISPYWQIRFQVAGIEVRQSARTRDRRAAEELEEQLRRDLWRQIKLGEQRFTWDQAVEKCRLEDSSQKSWERTWRCIEVLNEYLSGSVLTEITYEELLKLRTLLELRTSRGNGWKTKRPWKRSTCNRVLAVAGSILERCASDEWGNMLPKAPTVPLFELQKSEPKWLTRAQAFALLAHFPAHTADMMLLALATGLRRTNVTHLEKSRIDRERRCMWIPGYQAKNGEPIPVALNTDALAVIERWWDKHPRYLFSFRGRAPIKQVTTAMWRRECKAAGLEGVTFHSMRHSWASWHTQAGTPTRMLQEMGSWASAQMPERYSHLDPGHLAQYADRTLLGPDPREETVKLNTQEIEPCVSPCIGGKGGTRTLDPGIMRIVLVKKAS